MASRVGAALITSAAVAASQDVGDYRQTPHGLRPKGCIHGVPSGTTIEFLTSGSVRHWFPNGSVTTLGPCDVSARETPSETANVGVPVAHYPAPVYSRTQTASPVQRMTAKYIVPEIPHEQNDQSIYIWIGIDPDDESNVMQPVLGWNRVGGTDPSQSWYGVGGWGIESWLMVPSGRSYFSETIWGFNPGDVIDGVMVADSSIGQNGYSIVTSGVINGQPVQTELRAVSQSVYEPEHLPAIQYETWNECLDDTCYQVVCDRMPNSPVVISDVVVEPAAEFYTTKGLVWDLRDRCGWGATLEQQSVSSTTKFTLTPPGFPPPGPSPSPSPVPPSPVPPPSPTPSPSPSVCPDDAQTQSVGQGLECVWLDGVHGLRIPKSAMPYCDYLDSGSLGYYWEASEGDYDCAASARKTDSGSIQYCIWQDGRRGFSVPTGAKPDCDGLSAGRIGMIFPGAATVLV